MCSLTYPCCEFCKIVNPDKQSVEECYMTRDGHYDHTTCPYLLIFVGDSICQWCLDDLSFTDC